MKATNKRIVEMLESVYGKDELEKIGETLAKSDVDDEQTKNLKAKLDELNEDNFTKSQKQSVTIEGWVARSRWGVYLYSRKPHQVLGDWEGTIMQRLSEYSFPDLKREDEPRKVKLTIEEV